MVVDLYIKEDAVKWQWCNDEEKLYMHRDIDLTHLSRT